MIIGKSKFDHNISPVSYGPLDFRSKFGSFVRFKPCEPCYMVHVADSNSPDMLAGLIRVVERIRILEFLNFLVGRISLWLSL